jgi:hypothetical protein
MAAVNSSPQDLRAFFRRGPPVGRERARGGGDRTAGILLIAERHATDDLAAGRIDDVHDLTAVRFHEGSINIVGGDRFDRAGSRRCLHRVSPSSRYVRTT